MRIEEREIVGAFIFSSDHKILLGFNRQGGVYQGHLTIPGGGIEQGEAVADALRREVREETGIDISDATIIPIEGVATGESPRISAGTQETVLVKMRFHDFSIQINRPANSITVKCEDDWMRGNWYAPHELLQATIAPNVHKTLVRLNFLSG